MDDDQSDRERDRLAELRRICLELMMVSVLSR